MASTLSRTVDRLRQPEYTGENRCVPCTAVNVAIAAVVAAGVAVASPPAGIVVLVVSLGAIYVRGYLVPGTPTLTKRYFPDWLLAKFDKAPDELRPPDDAAHGPDSPAEASQVDPERVLLDAGVVVPCDDEDDLCLADDVDEVWRERIAAARDGDRERRVAAFLEADPGDVDVFSNDETETVTASVDGRPGGRWESDAALVADLAAVDVLAERVESWTSLDLASKGQVASGLRTFVEACPACDGPVTLGEETVESCCRSHEVYAITCDDCGARILEVAQ